MTFKLRKITLFFVLATGCGIALAAGPDGHSTAATTEPAVPEGPGHGAVGQQGRGRGGMMRGEPTKDPNWDAAMAFMKTNSPLRAKAVADMPDSSPNKVRFEGMILFTYESTERLKGDADHKNATDHELYDTVVSRIQIEDTIFGLVAELQKTPADPALKTKLHEQVEKFVTVNLKERQLRLDRLKKTLDEEQAKLTKDDANKAQLVDERMDAAIKGDLQQFGMRGPRGGGNGGGGNGGGHNHQGTDDAAPAPVPAAADPTKP